MGWTHQLEKHQPGDLNQKKHHMQDCSPDAKSFSIEVAVEMMFCYAQLGIDLWL